VILIAIVCATFQTFGTLIVRITVSITQTKWVLAVTVFSTAQAWHVATIIGFVPSISIRSRPRLAMVIVHAIVCATFQAFLTICVCIAVAITLANGGTSAVFAGAVDFVHHAQGSKWEHKQTPHGG
jgi:hypothetical protein